MEAYFSNLFEDIRHEQTFQRETNCVEQISKAGD